MSLLGAGVLKRQKVIRGWLCASMRKRFFFRSSFEREMFYYMYVCVGVGGEGGMEDARRLHRCFERVQRVPVITSRRHVKR